MTDNQFDHFIRARLKDHSAPVPPGLWEKIHPAEKDDRKGFLLPKINTLGRYMIAIALLGVFAVGGYFYFSSKQDQKPAGNSLSEATEQKQAAPGTGAQAPATAGNAQAGSHNNAPLQDDNNNEKNNNIPVIPSTQSNKTSTVTTGDIHLDNTVTAGTQAGQKFLPANKTADNKTLEPVNNNSVSGDQASATAEIPQLNPHFNLLAASTISSDKNSRLYGLKNLEDLELVNAITHTRRVPNILICPSSRGGLMNPDWYIELYASPDLSFKSVQNVSATQQYMQRKDSSESSQVGFSAGFRIVKPFDDNLLLKAGLQYSQVNQRFVYRTENEVKTTTVVTVRQIIRAPGDTVLVRDTSVLQQIGYRNNTVRNHFRSIDIPVTLGYQFGRDDDDFRVGVNAGVVINLSSWYQGVILDPTLAAVPIDKSPNAVYKSNIGLGLYGSLSFMKRLNENSQLFFEPYFRYNLSNMTNAQSSYNQRFHIGGLAIGLRYNLNRR